MHRENSKREILLLNSLVPFARHNLVRVNLLTMRRFHQFFHRVMRVTRVAPRVLTSHHFQGVVEIVAEVDIRVLLDKVAHIVQLALGKHGVEKIPEATLTREIIVY